MRGAIDGDNNIGRVSYMVNGQLSVLQPVAVVLVSVWLMAVLQFSFV